MSAIPTSPSLDVQLSNAVAALAQAQDYLTRARVQVSRARSEETAAINRVNEAQRHFDALVAEVKKTAPSDTDWRRPAQQEGGAE